MTEKNFGLTKEEFRTLVSEMKCGDESLFEKIFLSQFETSIKHLMNKYRTSREEAYDICMDTLISFRKLLLTDKISYGNLKYLHNTIAGQTFLKHRKKQDKLVYREHLPEHSEEQEVRSEEELKLLDKAWNSLGDDCKYILKNFYYNEIKLYEIAEKLSKTPSAIRKQKERCVNTLRLNFRHFL